MLSERFLLGDGVTQSDDEALHHMVMAKDTNRDEALFKIGKFYLNNKLDSYNVKHALNFLNASDFKECREFQAHLYLKGDHVVQNDHIFIREYCF